MDVKAIMSKKVAGVPVVYVGALFVVILAVVAWRIKPAPEPTADESASDLTEDVTGGDPSYSGTPPVFVANPAPGYIPPDGGEAPPTIDDNEKWLRRSIEWLASNGHAPVDRATIALQKYLGGEQLSSYEGGLRDKAISQFGLPPELPQSGGTQDPPIDIPDPPVPNNPPPKKYVAPGFHTVSGTADDSYTDMARLFYGRSDNEAIDLIQSYNVSHGHQGPFPIGTRFWIPKYSEPKYIKATSTMRTATDIIKKNPPLNSVKMLQELNDGMKFPVNTGTRVRVA